MATGTHSLHQNEKVLVESIEGGSAGITFGTAATSKVAFFGVAPVSQRAGAVQVTVSPIFTQTSPFGFSTSALARDVINTQNEIVATLVLYGMWKGSA